MIQIRAANGETVSASATVVGGHVAVITLSCVRTETAQAFAAAFERRLLRLAARRRARTPARPPEAPADRFPIGAPVRVRLWEWNEGEMTIDATVVARLSAALLKVRTEAGAVLAVDERDLETDAADRAGVWPRGGVEVVG